MYTFYSTIYL